MKCQDEASIDVDGLGVDEHRRTLTCATRHNASRDRRVIGLRVYIIPHELLDRKILDVGVQQKSYRRSFSG